MAFIGGIMQLMSYNLDFLLEIGPKYDSYKSRCRSQKISFDIPFQYFDYIVKQKCYYCGSFDENKPNGIDRIDSKKGYISGNCVSSCWVCNRAKGDMSYKKFKKYLKKLGKTIENEDILHWIKIA